MRDIKIHPIRVGWFLLIIYYCLYEFTTRYSPFNSTIVNGGVLIVLVGCIALICLVVLCSSVQLNLSSIIWVPFTIVLANQIIHFDCPKSYFALYCLFVLLISCISTNVDTMKLTIKALKMMAVIGAIGVFLQLAIPSLHRIIISMFLNDNAVTYIQSYAARGYYSGFFHQVGDTAFYISAGIVAEVFSDEKRKKKIFLLFLFTFALILEGKRSLFLMLILVLLLSYVLKGRGNKKALRVAGALVVLLIVWVVLREISPLLSDITLFSKISSTISFLEEGNISGLLDSSGREKLYDLALELIKINPVTGIGWSEFSKVASTRFTGATSVHNIYLQLLCETGYIGLISFLVGALSSLFVCLTTRKKLNTYHGENKDYFERLHSISFCGQLLFLLFGFVENPIYNENCLIFYFLMVLLTFSLRRMISLDKEQKDYICVKDKEKRF